MTDLQWTLNVCTVCKDAVLKGILDTARHERVCGQKREPVEVVPLTDLTEVEIERDELEERRNTLAGQVLRYEAQGWASTLGQRAEAAETALNNLKVVHEAQIETSRRRAESEANTRRALQDAEEDRAVLVNIILSSRGYFRWGHNSWIHSSDTGTILTTDELIESIIPAFKRTRTTTTEGDQL